MAYASTDGPPPSPATDPTAAQEVGQPLPIGQLTNPVQIQPSGPDLSGVNMLGRKIVEALLSLAQAAPLIAPDLGNAAAMVENALGRFATQAGGTGTSSSMPMQAGGPTGNVVTQAGPQFPGGGMSAGRPF